MKKREYIWQDEKILSVHSSLAGGKTLIMGILNLTPDSFSDGGEYFSLERAIKKMQEMTDRGANIIDIGAESTRPGFQEMSAEAEIERLSIFLPTLVEKARVPLSIDTFKAKTAEFAAKNGVHILNDIWGLQNPAQPNEMAKVAKKYNLPVIAMHNKNNSEYSCDIIEDIKSFFQEAIKIAEKNGISQDMLIFDPGIGFGKTYEQNLEIMNRLGELKCVGGREFPILLGTSRKSFIGEALNLPINERMEATGATCVLGISKGAEIMRVHDVEAIAKMTKMTDIIFRKGRTCYIGLGSNMGDSKGLLDKAINLLENHSEIILQKKSSYIKTAPWGNVNQPDFLNGVIKIDFTCSEIELLHICQAIEKKLGRVRHEHWGPRTIDLDLLYIPNVEMDTEELKLPHPYMLEREFVLAPLLEIEPNLEINGKKISGYRDFVT